MENTVKTENVDAEILTEDKKKSRVAKIINICLTVALFTFIIALIFRMCQADHKELKKLYETEDYKTAYSISQDIRTHVAGNEFSDNGAIYAYSFVYIPEAKYMQLTVRYNNRHINEVITALNDNENDDSKSYTDKDINIFYTISDTKGNEYTPNVLDTTRKFNYTYFKLELTEVNFEDVNLNVNMMLENIKEIELEINGKTKKTLAYEKGNIYNSAYLEFHSKDDTYIPYK